MTRLVSGALLAAVLVAASGARADGPSTPPADKEKAESAKKDKKGAKPARPAPGKVYTEEDLKRYSEDPEGKARSESAPSEAAAAPEPEPVSPSEASQAYGGRQIWATRASDARDAIAAAQGQIAAIEERITGLRNDMAPGRETEAFREQGIQADIAKAMEELEAARKDLAKATKAHDDLLEEARRTGVPAGWVREP